MTDSTPLYALVTHEGREWRAIEKHIKARIESLSQRLEADQTEISTANLRGQIWALRALLRDATPPVDDGPENTTGFENTTPLY